MKNRDCIVYVTILRPGQEQEKFRFATSFSVTTNIAYIIADMERKVTNGLEKDNFSLSFDCTRGTVFVRYTYDHISGLDEFVLGENFLETNGGISPLNDIRKKTMEYLAGTLWTKGPEDLDAYLDEQHSYSSVYTIRRKDGNTPILLDNERSPLPMDLRILYEYSSLNPNNRGYPTVDMMHLLPKDMRPTNLHIELLNPIDGDFSTNNKKNNSSDEDDVEDSFATFRVSAVINNTLVMCDNKYFKRYLENYGVPSKAEFAAELLDDYLAEKYDIWHHRNVKDMEIDNTKSQIDEIENDYENENGEYDRD